MTTAATIAEQSTSLTISALGNTSGTAKAFISFATLVAAVAKHFKGNPSFDKAVASALAALKQANFPEADLITAQEWLASRPPLTLSPEKLAQHSGDVPAYLQSLLTTPAPPKDGTTLAILQLCLTAAFTALRHNPEFHAPFAQAILAQLSASSAEMHRKQDLALDAIAELREMLLAQAQRDQPQLYAQHTAMMIQLAQNYATGPVTDFESAYRNVENALRVYDEMRRQNALPHNAASHLDAVLARVQELNAQAQFDAARAELLQAKAQAQDRIAQEKSGLLRLLSSMVQQATLQNAPQDAADALIEQITLEAPPDPFAALRAVRRPWHQRYESHGVPFDGQVALALARATLARAGNDDEHGAAQNDLGNILHSLGELAGDAALLNQAIDAYRAALRVRSETETPQDWAMAQNNLGVALQILGQRAGDADLLRQATDAFRAALRVRSEADTPHTWAGTQNNLGNALLALGQIAGDAELSSQAQAAYRAALQVYSETDTPLDWAETTQNMAILDLAFFDLARDPAHLHAAQDRAMAARAVFLRLDAQGYLPDIDNLLAKIARLMSA
jgi:hypothetical protein